MGDQHGGAAGAGGVAVVTLPSPDPVVRHRRGGAGRVAQDRAALDGVHRWKLLTSQGEVTIELAPTLAPWHVASVASLTRAGFYDGLAFHRVVADFVVQGGDPTGTGWGGPGFTLPSEISASLEAMPIDYGAGAIGIADAGKDTGGSQWFAMHSPAPHLEGRYTWVGRVIEGADVLDRIQVGDRIIRARFE